MLCPHTFQSSFSPLVDFQWPVRSLWPETRPLFFQIEQEMIRHMQEMRHSLEFMERLHKRIFDEIDYTSPSAVFKPISFHLDKGNNRFAVTLDTNDFSPGELSVKQVGKKLRVSGKSEKKQDDGKGSYSYRCQEFRQEFDLPDGVSPEAVTCSFNDGKLQIQAPKETSSGENERVVPITYTPAVNGPSEKSLEPQNQPAQEDSSKSGDQL